MFVDEKLPAVDPDCDNTNRTNWAFIQSIRKYGELQLRGDRTYWRDQIHLFYPVLPHLSDSDQVYKSFYKR